MGIGRGDLDVERFKFYVAQDYVYLIDYALCWRWGRPGRRSWR